MKNAKIGVLLLACLTFCLSSCEEQVIDYISTVITETESDTETDNEKTESESETEEETEETAAEGEEETQHEADIQQTESQQFSEEALKSIELLREEMATVLSEPAIFGMAYVGPYFDDGMHGELDEWLISVMKIMPNRYHAFIPEIDKTHIVGEKGFLYCIIAQDPDSTISVNDLETGELLYHSKNGDPLLVFCNRNGDAQEADTFVTIKTTDGNEYVWEPTLSERSYPDMVFPNILVDKEYRLLSWDFGNVFEEPIYDFEGWLKLGWRGLTAVGLAYDENGTSWSITDLNNDARYILNLNIAENDDHLDGEAILDCYYLGSDELQAEWRGLWKIETSLEMPSLLYLYRMNLVDGADMAAYEDISLASGMYWLLAPQSGECITLVAEDYDTNDTVLPIFPEGEYNVTLDLVTETVEYEFKDDESVPYTESQQFSEAGGTSIDVLREEMRDVPSEPAEFGMCYIGYYEYVEETGIDFVQWYEHSATYYADCYPFVSEIDEAHTIGNSGHLYCVVGGENTSSIFVSDLASGEVLYRAENGEPILVFCSHDGDAHTADTVVTIKTKDGKEYNWEPRLDDFNYPDILVGDARRLLSWDIGNLIIEPTYDFDTWYENGWLGLTPVGLAYDENGITWVYSQGEESVSYYLTFCLAENETYDGDVVLECYYSDSEKVQAKWSGNWRIETDLEKASTLYVDMSLVNCLDRLAFESCSEISESYKLLASPAGDEILLVTDEACNAVLPVFPKGWQAVGLQWIDPNAVG